MTDVFVSSSVISSNIWWWVVLGGILLFSAGLSVLVVALRGRVRTLHKAEEDNVWRRLCESLATPCALISREGNVLVANTAARTLWGAVPFVELDKKRVQDLEGAVRGYQRLCSAVNAGLSEEVELALTGDGGRVEWWRIRVDPVAEGMGPVTAMVWSADDVTSRRVIEDVLVREREELAEFLFLAPVGFYSVNADGVLCFVNQRFAEWLGASVRDIQGCPLDDFLSGNSAPEMEGGWEGHLVFRDRSGGLFKAFILQSTFDDAGLTRTRSVVIREESYQPPVVVGDDHRFRLLFEGAPFGLCQLDLDGTVLDCNAAFVTMAGLPRDQVIDASLHGLLAPDAHDDLNALLSAAPLIKVENAMTIHREVRLVCSSDSIATLFIIPMEEGARDGLMAFFLDTTAQRTLELQFAQAQKMQAMGQLAGGIAHDFNNLLTAMIGFCDLLLQRHGPGDPSFSDLMQVKQNANRAANLVRQLLAFSRKQPLKPRLLDVTDALTELLHLLRRVLGETVQLDIEHGRGLGLVRVDPSQFDQVIVNLAVNARDAMKGAGKLTIRTRAETVSEAFSRGVEHIPPGKYTVLTVSDTGSGIPRENLGRIFEPFFSTKVGEVGAGTGLGLSTVYGIIRQTGGFVFVESTVGVGTTFTIYLPRQDIGSVNATVSSYPENEMKFLSSTGSEDLTGGGTLMLVEDEDPVRVFASRALRNKGYTVLEAVNGEQALDVLERHPVIDLLITDMVMPGMDGATLARTVRRDRPTVPVILISGYSEEAAQGELTDSADFHFLPKPFSLAQLAAKVKVLLSANPK